MLRLLADILNSGVVMVEECLNDAVSDGRILV
jgi:hypothetical protein